MSRTGGTDSSSRGLNRPPTAQEADGAAGFNDGTPVGVTEATDHGDTGGYAGSGMTDTLTLGSVGDPTDEKNLKGATTGASSAPGVGVIEPSGRIRPQG